jgi:hypothetical protein
MNAERRWICAAMLAVITTVVMADVSTAFAQRPWRANIYDRFKQLRSQRSMRHARDYSSDLHNYSRQVKKIEPQVAKQESAKLGENIAAAQHDLSAIRKSAADDKAVLAALDVIDNHLARAAETHKMLHAECQKEMVDGKVCTHCCNEITKELEKAMAEHAALLRTLDGQEQHDDHPPAKE